MARQAQMKHLSIKQIRQARWQQGADGGQTQTSRGKAEKQSLGPWSMVPSTKSQILYSVVLDLTHLFLWYYSTALSYSLVMYPCLVLSVAALMP